MLAAFLWGLAEATFFFVIPDVLLSFVAILDWPRTWKHVLAAIAGARAAVPHFPFIRESMFRKVSGGFRRQAWLSMLLGSVSGVPYKLYAVEAEIHQPARISSGDSAGVRRPLPAGLGWFWNGRIMAKEASRMAFFPAGHDACRPVDCFLRILLGAHSLWLNPSM